MKIKEKQFPLLLSRDFWRGCDFQGLGRKKMRSISLKHQRRSFKGRAACFFLCRPIQVFGVIVTIIKPLPAISTELVIIRETRSAIRAIPALLLCFKPRSDALFLYCLQILKNRVFMRMSLLKSPKWVARIILTLDAKFKMFLSRTLFNRA